MPTATITAREHLDWATRRALAHFDAANKRDAIMGFLADLGQHPDTAWIQAHPEAMGLLEAGYCQGRGAFTNVMREFHNWSLTLP